ncbi:protein fem-1 homolog C-like isoform X3 [Pomacea canaliculata]|uniref:protein fem-1 homolog C-like isoform X2 n=1 Tax=Pomacea canaliculata TaxID=400727 RepID=UPI000D72FB26|nr:protein fem-1 homolog C-like isoform X2 [Pomacea canaliculata]XP_025095617.1 protein fem-1 homolog C-like isoform X3 [Pomacea canaliculata]
MEVRKKRMESNDLLADRQVAWFMSLLQQCIRNNKLEKMRFVMKRLSLAQRRQLATFRYNTNSMLFTCCQMGHVDMVNYLLDECGADLEQKGVYEVSGDGSRHMVTPLWCAAVADHIDVVESLIKHGADLNSQSDTGSTPVRSACYMTNIEVVKRLVEAGADIHLPNMNGGTCLINSVQSPELCEFLIKHGARVNDRDKSNNLALHYAIREDRLDTVKLLVEYGSDYNAKNDYNDNALQTAALRGYEDIVEYLIESTRPSLVDVIHAYELLGASYVDERHDIARAMALWQKAINLREIGTKGHFIKTLKRERIAAYDFVKEVTTQEDLKEAGCDPDNVYMQALLIRERILGKNHKDTSFGVMYRGAVYADSRRFQRCVDLWKYAYHLRFTGCSDPLNHELVFTVQALVKLFWEMHVDETEEGSCEKLRCCDLVDTLEELIHHIQAAQTRIKMLQKEPASCITQAHQNSGSASIDTCPGYSVCACGKHREGNIEDFCLLMQLSIHLIFLFSAQPDVNDDVKHYFCTLVYQLLKIDARTQAGETLLHLALSVGKTNLTPDFCLKPLPVVKILLECGADADALTKAGQTPLLCCLRQENSMHNVLLTNEKRESLILCLLKHGAHADRAGHLPVVQFLKESRSFSVLDHVNLQCLAAQVICKHRILYKGMLPATLEKFVGMH